MKLSSLLMKPHLLGVVLALALVVTVGAGAPAATADVDCPQTKAVFYTTDTEPGQGAGGEQVRLRRLLHLDLTDGGGPAARRTRSHRRASAGSQVHALAELQPKQWASDARRTAGTRRVMLHDAMLRPATSRSVGIPGS